MKKIKWMSNESFPLEMHKARVVQKLNLLEAPKRLKAMEEAGFNTFLLKNRDVFLDMLTDSGVNAMSDKQQAVMLQADDSYAVLRPSSVWRQLSKRCSAQNSSYLSIRVEPASTSFLVAL